MTVIFFLIIADEHQESVFHIGHTCYMFIQMKWHVCGARQNSPIKLKLETFSQNAYKASNAIISMLPYRKKNYKHYFIVKVDSL